MTERTIDVEQVSSCSVPRRMHEILSRYWGYSSFRDGQEEIICSIAEGRDTLALLPTGAGKSVCYQVPGILRGGVTLVVSPLISLMHDQVAALSARGVAAFAMTGRIDAGVLTHLRKRMNGVDAFFLYTSPERQMGPQVSWLLEGRKLGLIAVDEAHCVSSWGHDFRPAYREIKTIRKVHDAPMCAFTATATRVVQRDMIRNLGLRDPAIIRRSFDRPNIRFSVLRAIDARTQVLEHLERYSGAAILYDSSREGVEVWAEKLRRAGISTVAYHGGMSTEVRAASQQKWMRKRVRVIVATNAFGMGIDRPDVKLVLHVGLPDSIESYYQEAGRAGRDGRPAQAILVLTPESKKARRAIAEKGGRRQRYRAERLIKPLMRHADRDMCRRWGMLGYFGERVRVPCGNCDVCGAREAEKKSAPSRSV